MTPEFPAKPSGDTEMLKQPSSSFKKAITKMRLALVLFVIVYILLTLSALVIALAMILVAYTIAVAVQSLIVLVIALGLVFSAITLMYFLFKFLFKKSLSRYNGVEVTAVDQPLLFDFISKLTTETGAPFPKHVYLTAEVNAFVSFDSAFWSMFFPSKKNLTIGLGLVNSLNVSEFKAVMAHEFGHFSQRSMRFGSYVHNFNKIVYSALYENTGYTKLLNAWGRGHMFLRFAAILNIKIVECIQEILKKTYTHLNRTYMLVSREMEFQADTIAACSAGSNNSIACLRRLEIADTGYTMLLDYWNRQLGINRRPENWYTQHCVLLRQLGDQYGLEIDQNGVPIVEKKLDVFRNTEVTINNQWASHPSLEEREFSLERLNLAVPPLKNAAWELFNSPELLQKKFTDILFETAEINDQTKIVGTDEFSLNYEQEADRYSFDKAYKGYYDSRPITQFDIEDAIAEADSTVLQKFTDLFNGENCNLPARINGMESDLASLDIVEISHKNDITSFTFRGKKYKRDEIEAVRDIINKDIYTAKKRIARLDREIFVFFYKTASENKLKQHLSISYSELFNIQSETQKELDLRNNIVIEMAPVYQTMPFEKIHRTVNAVYKQEKSLKPRLKQLLDDPKLQPYLTVANKHSIENYLSNNWIYFLEPKYDSQAIKAFADAMEAYASMVVDRAYDAKNKLLNFQLDLLP